MSNQKQKDFFVKGWFIYVLWKLGLADDSDIHPTMLTKLRIHQIESKIQEGKLNIMSKMEKDIYWGEEKSELEPEKKS